MGRKKSDAGMGYLLVLAGIVAAVGAAVDWVRANAAIAVAVVVAIAAIAAIAVYSRRLAREERFKSLVARFGSEDIAHDIMARRFWVGQSAEQLMESLGQPAAMDKQVLKTKRKETWKYGQVRKNQFALRITLENDEVVGWDKKGA